MKRTTEHKAELTIAEVAKKFRVKCPGVVEGAPMAVIEAFDATGKKLGEVDSIVFTWLDNHSDEEG